jgi:undecaprenyl-diphosphatase
MVALSRVVLGAHYPTDVLGGVALGAAWLLLMIALWDKLVYQRTVRAVIHVQSDKTA